ncbi:MAG: formylglycine-generating enzyme family protein [Cyclobacteriaceae bacterium]|nr:formylglycine-generating enzyme family protein [Cyclobacteriaceae bacterium]
MLKFSPLMLGIILIVTLSHAQDVEVVAYVEEIPGSQVAIEMVPVQGGSFVIGSPDTEADRDVDEGPQREVEVDGFWMGKFEITWDQYELFMQKENIVRDSILSEVALERETEADAISRPSPPYEDPSFGMGKYGYPAGSMTQFAALMYCKWLSTMTGKFYRLPTEAEWEYACRAGTTTAYYSGDNVAELDEYGWHYGNALYTYHKVGEKKPNQFGIYDMMGNVAEWTLDHYYPDYYEKLKEEDLKNPWSKPAALYPRTVRGGSYDDDPDMLRCASRIPSNPEKWKQRDPQIPKSFWWNTDSPFVGFRVVRPFEELTKEEQDTFWAINLDED